jgi:tetratricopeptide (TPR) repeat protein
MKNIFLFIIIFSILFSCSSPNLLLKKYGYYNFSVENANWILKFPADDFKLKTEFYESNGLTSFITLMDYTSGFTLYIRTEINLEYDDTESYLDYIWDISRRNRPAAKNVKKVNTEESSFVTYHVPEELNKGCINVIYLKDDIFVDILLSKLQFTIHDNSYLQKFFTTLKFEKKINFKRYLSEADSIKQTETKYFLKGSYFYVKKNYEKSSKWYQMALDLEKEYPNLEKKYLYVLIDNLGMSYGISGNYKKAEDIFKYGLAVDSTYPMFYYNLACTYAETDNLEKCIENLKAAFRYKQNMMVGEKIPDPKEDSSFNKFLNNEEFKKALDEINSI